MGKKKQKERGVLTPEEEYAFSSAEKRGRAYTRQMREVKIRDRKHFCLNAYGYPWYTDDGKYSKGKIFCSCPMCRYQGQNLRDEKRILSARQQEDEYAGRSGKSGSRKMRHRWSTGKV